MRRMRRSRKKNHRDNSSDEQEALKWHDKFDS